jgi:glycerol-3-phosphate O-acyltransferase
LKVEIDDVRRRLAGGAGRFTTPLPRPLNRSVNRLIAGTAPAGQALDSDALEVAQLLSSPEFIASLGELAEASGRPADEVLAEAGGCLREMAAWHDPRVTDYWHRFSAWMVRGYDVLVDDDALARLRRLDRKHSLILLISHRSYLDEFIIPPALEAGGLSGVYGMAGANLDFFPLGTVARRTGIVHVRRATADAPVYRLALRSFIGQLVHNRANLLWSIEGGRSRTGKLRPPRYGLLRYVADAVESTAGAECLLVPVSIMYDQLPLHEVGRMVAEARGADKKPEDVRWFLEYARGLQHRLGRAYLDFGEPLPLRERLAELRAEDVSEKILVERVALDVCHRINEATPVTATAAVCVALLGAGRALTLDEVLTTVAPLAGYLSERGRPVAGGATLTDRSTVRWALRELTRSGVLTSYSGGAETVWGIGPDQHLIAAVYRNTAIHVLVERAIAELCLLAAADSDAPDGDRPSERRPDANGDAEPHREVVWEEALRLRELLKFDFFFPQREQFIRELAREIAIMAAPDRPDGLEITPEQARIWLARARPLVAHLVLRPYLDAYRLVGEQLAAADDDQAVDVEVVVRDCLRLGRQWSLQRTLASEESVSGEMFRTALKLAQHRDLLKADAPQVGKRRRDFADELREVARDIGRIAAMAPDATG